MNVLFNILEKEFVELSPCGWCNNIIQLFEKFVDIGKGMDRMIMYQMENKIRLTYVRVYSKDTVHIKYYKMEQIF